MTKQDLIKKIATGELLPIFKFEAYNTESFYGFGSEEEANRYCDHLNKDRDINVFGAGEITDPEEYVMANSDSAIMNIEEELAAIA